MLRSLLRELAGSIGFTNNDRDHRATSQPAVFPSLESLEARCLMSASPTSVDRPAMAAAAAIHASPSRASRPAPPSRVAATAVSTNRINLTWSETTRNVTAFYVYRRISSRKGWALAAKLPASRRRFSATGLASQTSYDFRVRAFSASGGSNYSNIATAKTTASASPGSASAGPGAGSDVPYSAPIVITHGGTYSGNWQSLNPNVPAVEIQTNEPVIIENAHIRSRGTLIDASGRANVTVRNTYGYGLNPNIRGRYPGRFLNVEGFTNVVAQNNYMEGTSGIYVYGYNGNHTAAQTVKITGNVAHNIDGRYSNGNGGYLTGPDDNFYVQFFQTNGVWNVAGAEVAWNQVINDPGNSRVEDNISIFSASGTAASPFLIHDNYIQGAYAADPLRETSYTGGGIMLSDVGSAWIRAYNNQVVSTTNYGIAISSGHDNQFYNNRIVSSGLLPNGQRIASQNVGAYIWNQNGEKTFVRNSGHDNFIGWAQGAGRNDSWTPDAASWVNNASQAGAITRATEAAEYTLWQSKLSRSGVRIGPAQA